MKIKWFLIAISLILNSTIFAQLSEGGIPPSFQFSERNALKKNITTRVVAPLADIDELKKEDSQIPSIGYPQRIGTSIPAEIDLYEDGVKSELENGDQIIRYTIEAKDAAELIVYYNDFYIPQGGKLFIYGKDKSQVIGAFTHNTNPSTGQYATEAIHGNQLTLEYVVSKTSEETPRIKIGEVGYLYYDPYLDYDSEPCMIDINCPEGANWQTQKRGVTYLITRDSRYIYRCSGALVNNTAKDKKPYILSAFHCLPPSNPIYAQFLVYFNYENDTCGSERTTTPNSLTGMSLAAISPLVDGSDGLLLLLNANVPDEWKPYYNGWDVSGTIPESGVVIHHPNGDVKKITTYSKKPTISGNIAFEDEDGSTAANSAWRVTYSSSITQGGSSGSPIFNQKGLIVGTLSGGSTTCAKPTDFDYYGRLYFHWDKFNTSKGDPTKFKYHFKEFLDPTGSGALSLEGLNYDPSSINEDLKSESSKNIVVFPSPLKDELNVNCNEIIRELSIIDMAGKQVYVIKDYDSSTIAIPVPSLAKGVYSVIVKTSEGNICSEKVIKQ